MLSGKYKTAAWIIFSLAFFARVYHLNIPFIEPYNSITRQTVVGMIARNFYRHGFNLFYPEIDSNGPGISLFNAEMPIYAYLMAIGYKLTGGVHEWAARCVPVLFSMGTLLFLYLFVKRILNERTATYALFFASFSPLNLALSRSAQPDATMLFASVGSLYTFYLYQETKKIRHYFYSLMLMMLAVATKAYTLYLFIPIFYMAWQFQGKDLFRDLKNYAYAAGASLMLVWYAAMWYSGKVEDLAYNTLNYRPGNGWGSVFAMLSWPYFLNFAKIIFIHILTPIGSVLFLAGASKYFRDKASGIFNAWFLSVIIFTALFWNKSNEHSYYQLPFIPVFAFYVARGAEWILLQPQYKRVLKNPVAALMLTAIFGVSLLHFYKGLYFIPEEKKVILTAGKAVDSLTPKDSLVLASFEGSTALLYYCDRKGWEFDIRRPDSSGLLGEVEVFKKKGAQYFVIAGKGLQDLHREAYFEKQLRRRYARLEEGQDFVIFKLEGIPNALYA